MNMNLNLNMVEAYNTLPREASAELIEKKSRFIARARPVPSEDEARAFVNAVRREHRDARHNCYAYRINPNRPAERASDDGEPTGTAGMPMLDILRGSGLFDCVVVVTRYFGGTLLGTGGLVRAYGQAARLAVEEAGVLSLRLFDHWSVKADYPMAQRLRHELETRAFIHNTAYAEEVDCTVLLDPAAAADLRRVIMDITAGSVQIVRNPPVYCFEKDGGLVIRT